MFKRITSVFLVMSTAISLLVVPASAVGAAEVLTFIEWSSNVYGAYQFWEAVSDGLGDLVESDDAQRPLDLMELLALSDRERAELIKDVSGGGTFTSSGSGGSRRVKLRYFLPYSGATYSNGSFYPSSNLTDYAVSTPGDLSYDLYGYTKVDMSWGWPLKIIFNGADIPFTALVTYGSEISATGATNTKAVKSTQQGLLVEDIPAHVVSAGNKSYSAIAMMDVYAPLGFLFRVNAAVWADVEPVSGSVGDMFPTINITDNSRVGSLVGDYYFENSNGNWVAESIQVVNEGDNIFYNPYTDQSTNFDSFTYDYAEREYNLYADDGSHIGKVVYGDEYVTIEEGGNTYNFYYYIGSGGSDEPPEETRDFYEWWKNAWTSFTDRLFAVLRPSGGSGADDDTITENTPPQTDDEGNEWSLGDLTKAALQGVWKIGSGIVKVTVGGVTYLIETITDAGDFFAPYNDSSGETGIYSMFNEEGSAA